MGHEAEDEKPLFEPLKIDSVHGGLKMHMLMRKRVDASQSLEQCQADITLFYKLIGEQVELCENVKKLFFKELKLTSDTVNGFVKHVRKMRFIL